MLSRLRTSLRAAVGNLRDAFFTQPGVVCALPTVTNLSLDPDWVRKAAHVHRLAELGRREVRNVTRETILNPDSLWGDLRSSLESGCILWVITIRDAAVWDEVESALPGLLVQLGPVSDDGQAAYGFQTASVARYLLDEHPEMAMKLRGIDSARVPTDILQRLDLLGVPVYKRPRIMRLLRNPRLYVYFVVFAYSALRALPVVFIKEFQGSLLVLWSIDVLTAIPYTWGVLAMAMAPRRSTRVLGALTTVATFVAPYVYFWYHGRDYPPYVIVVIALMVIAGISLEVWKFRQERSLERRYVAGAEFPEQSAIR